MAHIGNEIFNKNTVLGTVPPQPPKMDRESVNLAIKGFYEVRYLLALIAQLNRKVPGSNPGPPLVPVTVPIKLCFMGSFMGTARCVQ